MMLRPTVRVSLIATCLLVSTIVRAADMDALKDTTPAERAKAQTAMMTMKIGLTDAEVAKVGPINLKYAEKMDPIIKGSDLPVMKMRAARSLEGQKEGELKAVLTPDQFQQFLAMKEDMLEKLADAVKEQRAKGGQ